ncbi:MAG TPA: VIT1/CCC1 transporter family protein, partial [Afifellaceae bacterium]|nr:VIT1/CCC1 transporter family protein [Afifellaceae bacterium]
MKLGHSHAPDAIAARVAAGPRVNYLRDWVYGGIDGAITTFAIVAGVVGAELSASIVLILGAANLLADGFSMAAANYTGTKAEIEDYQRIKQVEKNHVDVDPEGEREEIRQIFAAKGLEGGALDAVVDAVTSDPDLWIDMMMSEEHGLGGIHRSPVHAGIATFAAFFIFGGIPLLPFVFGLENSAWIATFLTAIVFFLIGALK